MSSMTKDTLEGMAKILRENGYIVKETRVPYKVGEFNPIETLDLNTLSCETCIFVNEEGLEDLKGGICYCSRNITVGYIEYLPNDYILKDVRISTHRNATKTAGYEEELSKYDYVCKCRDVFKDFF